MRSAIFILFFNFMLPLWAQQSDFDKIDFTEADQIARRHRGEELYNVALLAHNLTFQLDTEAARFRAIYYWVTHNIKNDADLVDKNDSKRKLFKDDPERLNQWNTNFKKVVFQKLREDKKTLCTGYAYLIQELSQRAGLECEIIQGYGLANNSKFKNGDVPNHSWNAVKLDGKWYLCDATWSSGYTDATGVFEFDYDNSFFLMEPSEFLKGHLPVDKKWILTDNSIRVNELKARQ